MFHEAQEWKRVQTFHALMVAMAACAVVWNFKYNLWLITLWPHHCTLEIPSETAHEIPWHTYYWFTPWKKIDLFLYAQLFALFFITESGLRRFRKACEQQHSEPLIVRLHKETGTKGRDNSSCETSFYFLPNIFSGRKEVRRNLSDLMINTLCFVIF